MMVPWNVATALLILCVVVSYTSGWLMGLAEGRRGRWRGLGRGRRR